MSIEVEIGDSGERQPRKSTADRLVDLAVERYEFGCTEDREPYALDANAGHVVRMLRGGKLSMRAELASLYRKKFGKVAPQQALADALLVLEGIAQEAEETTLDIRVGQHSDGSVWLDLGDKDERAVQLAASGWRVEKFDVPIRFRRTKLTGAMPIPVRGGKLDELWDLLNVTSADRALLLAWLIAALIAPEIPHPILALFGEQGTGKTSASKLLVSLVDPSPVPLRKPPKDPEGWVTAASGSWVVGLDNLSEVRDWFSDSLCRAVTGDGDVRRALYTDGGLSVFAFRRCVLINGIDLGALRGDLADRAIVVNLDRLNEHQRRTETEMAERFRKAWPRIFGALLDEACAVLALLPSINLTSRPRMADFAQILGAVDLRLGSQGLASYATKAQTLAADTLDSDPFLVVMRQALTEPFEGSSAELLETITPPDPGWRRPQGWPRSARAVTVTLKRNAPALRQSGWGIEQTGRIAHSNVTGWELRPPESTGTEIHPLHPNTQATPTVVDSEVGGVGGVGGDASGPSQAASPNPHDDGLCRDLSHTPKLEADGSMICRNCGREAAA